jgi:hypothetical protein
LTPYAIHDRDSSVKKVTVDGEMTIGILIGYVTTQLMHVYRESDDTLYLIDNETASLQIRQLYYETTICSGTPHSLDVYGAIEGGDGNYYRPTSLASESIEYFSSMTTDPFSCYENSSSSAAFPMEQFTRSINFPISEPEFIIQ